MVTKEDLDRDVEYLNHSMTTYARTARENRAHHLLACLLQAMHEREARGEYPAYLPELVEDAEDFIENFDKPLGGTRIGSDTDQSLGVEVSDA